MATQKFVVTGEQYRTIDRSMREIKRQLDQKDGNPLDPEWVAQELQLISEGRYEVWLENILAREYACHLAFFGQEFGLIDFANTLKKYGESKIKFWQKLGLEPAYFPPVSFNQGDNYWGWKVKPEAWFYEKIAEGKIFRDVSGELKKIEKVTLEGTIEQLRQQGRIAKYEYGPQSSRFGVSADEWENQIKSVLADGLGLETAHLRLELTIEANIIPQLYPHILRKNDGDTNTWVWYEEYFGGRGHRLNGGHSDNGGLANVNCSADDSHWNNGSFRPLAVSK